MSFVDFDYNVQELMIKSCIQMGMSQNEINRVLAHAKAVFGHEGETIAADYWSVRNYYVRFPESKTNKDWDFFIGREFDSGFRYPPDFPDNALVQVKTKNTLSGEKTDWRYTSRRIEGLPLIWQVVVLPFNTVAFRDILWKYQQGGYYSRF